MKKLRGINKENKIKLLDLRLIQKDKYDQKLSGLSERTELVARSLVHHKLEYFFISDLAEIMGLNHRHVRRSVYELEALNMVRKKSKKASDYEHGKFWVIF